LYEEGKLKKYLMGLPQKNDLNNIVKLKNLVLTTPNC